MCHPPHGLDGFSEALLGPACQSLPPHLPDHPRALPGRSAPSLDTERTVSTPLLDAILCLDARKDAMTRMMIPTPPGPLPLPVASPQHQDTARQPHELARALSPPWTTTTTVSRDDGRRTAPLCLTTSHCARMLMTIDAPF